MDTTPITVAGQLPSSNTGIDGATISSNGTEKSYAWKPGRNAAVYQPGPSPGEIVFDPFTGMGSVGYIAIKRDRRFYGTEIKGEYYDACIENLDRAIAIRRESSRTLFDMIEEREEEAAHA
jgi:hypothetical protein